MSANTHKQRFLVLGGMNMDILGYPRRGYYAKDSNIGKVRLKPGGVGRNIAEQLALAGAATYLLTAMGNDSFAQTLQASCTELGIDLSLALRFNDPSPIYLAVHDAQGDMTAAVNDMDLLNSMTPEVLSGQVRDMPTMDAAVLDANIPQESIEYFLSQASCPVLADPVSLEKAMRLVPVLSKLYAIKPNRIEAEALTGEANPEKAAQKLLDMGVKQVYISMGAEGVWFADMNQSGHIPSIQLVPSSLTGAGDAMCAGLTMALAKGMDAAACAMEGVRSATKYLKIQAQEMET